MAILSVFGSALTVHASLIHRYSFTSDASDAVGGANGTVNGGVTISGGQAIFNGTNGYVSLPPNLLTNLDSVTFELWMTDNGSLTWSRVFDFGNSSGGNGTRFMCLIPHDGVDNSFEGAFSLNGGPPSQNGQVVTTPLLSTGDERQVVFTVDANSHTAKLYVNGVQAGVNSNFTLTPAMLGATANDWLGRSQFSSDGAAQWFTGSMDEFRIHDAALSALQAAVDAAAGPDNVVTNAGPLQMLALNISTNMNFGGLQNATVTGNFANVAKVDLSSLPDLSITSSAPGVVSVAYASGTWTLSALTNGMATLTAAYQSMSTNLTVTVVSGTIATTIAGLPVYTDHLVNGFQDWSYGAHNLGNVSPVHSGGRSISVSETPGQNISFYHPFDTSPYASFSFWANGGAAGGQVLLVQALLNEVAQPQIYRLIPLSANIWQQYNIPLAALGAGDKTNFDRMLITLSGGGTSGTYYLDDIQFGAAPAPAVTHISVNATQIVRTVDARMFGLNTGIWDSDFSSAQTTALLMEMGALTLRFPGGSLSDDYHWATDTTDANTWTWANSFGNFAQIAANLGAQAIITVNYGTGTSNEAAGWVRSSNVTNHFGFRYWEIGNECYGGWETDSNSYPHDPYTYATLAANFILQMKAADPSIKIGVPVSAGESGYSNGYTNHPAYNPRTGQTNYGWTPVALTTFKSLGVTPDFLICHFYPESGGDESDPLLLQSSFGSPWRAIAAGFRQQISDYLGPAGTNIELLVTENNSCSGPQGRQSTSLVNALYYADSLSQLMQSEFNSLVWWDLRNGTDLGGNMDATLYGWRTNGDLGMIYGLTNRYPEYYAAKLMRYFTGPGDTVVNAASDYLLLSAYAVLRTNGNLTLLVINKDTGNDFTGQVALNSFIPNSTATVQAYAIPQDDAAKTGIGWQDILTTNVTFASTNFSYSFSPLSLTLFTLIPQARFAQPVLSGGTNLVMSWTGGGILESATDVTGPWETVTNAASPYTNAIKPSVAQLFFRVKQ